MYSLDTQAIRQRNIYMRREEMNNDREEYVLDAYSSTLIFNLSSPNTMPEWLLRNCGIGSGTMGQ